MNQSKPRSHRVAEAAYQRVLARNVDAFKDHKKQYGSLAHKLPTLILQNGLAQATGFLLAKDKTEHLALLDDLAHMLDGKDGKSLHHDVIIKADTAKTMLLTRHSLEAAGWIKRYVQGVLKVDATGEESGNG